MDLGVPDHLRDLVGRLRRFVAEEVIPVESVLEKGMADPEGRAELRRLQDLAKQADLWALGHPKHLGGAGLQLDDYMYVNEVIGTSEYAMFVLGTHTLHDAMMLDAHASIEWRTRYLEPLVSGEIASPAFAMTEKDVAGSDPTALQTTATVDGHEWVITGRKWFTTHAHSAEYTVVFARTEPDAPPHDAFSMIIVPSTAPGYRVVRAVPTMGDEDGDHCEVEYDHVRVPLENLLGDRGAGFRIAQERLGPGRLFHCMRFLGQAERAFDLMCDRATTRQLRGGLMGDLQLIQQMIFESYSEILAVRLLVLHAAAHLQESGDARIPIGVAKVQAARALHNVVDRAIQVHGSLGVSDDLPLARMYRNARYARIYDGPDEAHVSNVARILLRDHARMAAAHG